jgi:CheY-like chemotaxis protein
MEARDGKEALAANSTAHVMGDAIDLVLLDINMPVMNGFEMLEQLRADPAMSVIPVVMQTSSTYDKDKERARCLGAAGYIEKPVKFEDLVAALDAVPSVRLIRADNAPPALVAVKRDGK